MIRIFAALACIALAGLPPAVHASRPVKKSVTACVVKGELTSGRYTYRVRPELGAPDTDLGPYEGKRILVKGALLPGDILIARSIEVVSTKCAPAR